ncbi:ribonuclease PH [Knoellia koreensis]|uniref:Ribonuclease PH n=1 Tax=Knoellia koreensis TaxID=2730921 RepID=A0A849HCI6_9MICO|nr:ribonuclease PH [Knoellia sp. DB2414S]NNM45645.1 ribonuclease PH [Knoellia sp. DB2414S]
MKRGDVIKKIKKAAKAASLEFEQYELTRHTGIRVGGTSTTISRSSSDMPDVFAETIFKQLESELGKGWWRS